jgi:small GTP-binding protein
MKKPFAKGKTIGTSDTAGSGGNLLTKMNQKITMNIAVLGDPKSGKTSLIESFLQGTVSERFKDTVLNIYQSNVSEKKFKIDINYFDISGYYERDKDVINEYLRVSDIVIICSSFEQDFNEENINYWLDIVEKNCYRMRGVYLVSTKYDVKVMTDYQKGANITAIMFPNGNLHAFGERIKTYINTNAIKEYYIVSALINFNVKELFHSIMKDFAYDTLMASNKGEYKDQNCSIF